MLSVLARRALEQCNGLDQKSRAADKAAKACNQLSLSSDELAKSPSASKGNGKGKSKKLLLHQADVLRSIASHRPKWKQKSTKLLLFTKF